MTNLTSAAANTNGPVFDDALFMDLVSSLSVAASQAKSDGISITGVPGAREMLTQFEQNFPTQFDEFVARADIRSVLTQSVNRAASRRSKRSVENKFRDGRLYGCEHFRALGISNNAGKVYCYVWNDDVEMVQIFDVDRLDAARLSKLADVSWWHFKYPPVGKGESPNWLSAARDVVMLCKSMGYFQASRLRGLGIWQDCGRTVAHLGDRLLVNGIETSLSDFDGDHVYQQQEPLPLDLDGPDLSPVEVQSIIDGLRLVSWGTDPETSAHLFWGWIAASVICGLMPVRPNMWVHGASNSGKSWLYNRVAAPALMGFSVNAVSASTEAGIRQKIGIHSQPLLLDEAESESDEARDRMAKIIEMTRASYQEMDAQLLKGTTNHLGQSFQMRTMAAFFAIGVGVREEQDLNRTCVLEVQRFDSSTPEKDQAVARRKLKIEQHLSPLTDAGFSGRLFKTMLSLGPRVGRNQKALRRAMSTLNLGDRTSDWMSCLIAASLTSVSRQEVSDDEALEIVRGDFEGIPLRLAEFAPAPGSASTDIRDYILNARAEVDLDLTTQVLPIRIIIDRAITAESDRECDRYRAALSSAGIRYEIGERPELWVANRGPEISRTLTGYKYSGSHAKLLRSCTASASSSGTKSRRFGVTDTAYTIIPVSEFIGKV